MNQENQVTAQDTYELRWKELYALYVEFKQKFHREPKQKEQYKGTNLGTWVTVQRQKAKKDVLSKERICL